MINKIIGRKGEAMKMNDEENVRPKIIMVPYPAQGHVTPMIKLATALAGRGFRPILVIPEFFHRRISGAPVSEPIFFSSIPDGIDDDDDSPVDFFSIEKAMETQMPTHFQTFLAAELRQSHFNGGGGGGEVLCVVVDLLASWAIRVARECGVQVAGFWPAMFATYRLIAAVPEMISRGIVSNYGNPIYKGYICLKDGEPIISEEHFPWLIGNSSSRASRFKFWIRTLERSRTLHCILINSFICEEEQSCNYNDDVVNYNPMIISPQEFPRPLIFPIGNLSRKRDIPANEKLSLWEEDRSCLDWLDKQSHSSVIYISFGSWVNPIGSTKIETLALALESSRIPFVWSLRHAWREGLPKGYTTRVSKQGIVVSWVPQMELLSHKSVGCYLTHCGWNSIIEAIQCRKPLLCYPVAGDQFVNCAYVVDMWKIGIRLGEFGQRDDVEEGLRRAMENRDVTKAIARLNERVVGKHHSLQVNANLTSFVDGLNEFMYK